MITGVAVAWAAVALTVGTGLVPIPNQTLVLVCSATAAALVAGRAVRSTGGTRLVFGLWAVAQTLFALGDAVWAVNELRGVGTDSVSVADALYLSGYPVLAVAVGVLVVRRSRGAAWAALTDGAIVGAVTAMLIAEFLFGGMGEGSLQEWLVAAAYPMGDTLLLACVAWLVLAPGRRNPALLLITGHLTVTILADFMYALNINGGGSGQSPVIDTAYAFSYLPLALAALHPTAATLAEPVPVQGPPGVGVGRVMLLGVGITGAPVVAVVSAASGRDLHLWVLLPVAVTLALVIVARMAAIVRRANLDRLDATRSEAILAHRATHDTLTGLANRPALLDALERSLRDPGRDRSLAVMFIDLDEFKLVNDSYGHVAGDELLVEVAGRITTAVRDRDLVARLGGDEFVVLGRDIGGVDEAAAVAGRIIDALDAPFRLRDGEVYVTGSIGIALAEPGKAADAEGLMRDADIALYRAKDGGRSRYQVFGADMRYWVAQRHTLENDLRRAVDGDELSLVYQPQVDLASGRVVGVEALVRWDHPTRGRVSPSEFIPVAEAVGLIVPLGNRVLAEACRDARRWNPPGAEPLRVAVNVSARQVAQADMVETVRGTLADACIDPRLIVLELTETALAGEPARMVERLRLLRGLGVALELDDFGVGQSSLAALRSFPLDAVKIDRGFMDDVGTDGRATRAFAAVVELARALGLQTVAEGVETRAQADALAALGCTRAQGYLFAHPVPAGEIDRLVADPARRASGMRRVPAASPAGQATSRRASTTAAAAVNATP